MKIAIACTMLLALVLPESSRAQWMVSDPLAEQNLILQYAAMLDEMVVLKEQLEEAQASLTVSKSQLKAIGEGVSNIGKDNFEDYTKEIPTDWRSTLSIMKDEGSTGGSAKSIRDEASLLNEDYFSSVPEETKSELRDRMDSEATNQALNSAVFDATGDRFKRLEDLRSRIDGAHDLKTINDLQARIQIENGMLMNEMVKLQSMNQVIDSDRRVKAETGRQRRFKVTEANY